MTAPDQYGQNVQIFQMTDAPSIPGAAQALADGIIPRTVMRFASASARGATLAGAYAPVEGMATYLLDVNRLEVYNGSAWVTPPQTLTSTTSGLSGSNDWSSDDIIVVLMVCITEPSGPSMAIDTA